jgi:hypothetical protein
MVVSARNLTIAGRPARRLLEQGLETDLRRRSEAKSKLTITQLFVFTVQYAAFRLCAAQSKTRTVIVVDY